MYVYVCSVWMGERVKRMCVCIMSVYTVSCEEGAAMRNETKAEGRCFEMRGRAALKLE